MSHVTWNILSWFDNVRGKCEKEPMVSTLKAHMVQMLTSLGDTSSKKKSKTQKIITSF